MEGRAGRAVGFDWRLLASGYLDALLYERRVLDTRIPLPELRALSAVTDRAKRCSERADFSSCIRESLPLPGARGRATRPAP